MIIKVANHGHSQKGAAAYYLHDKAQENDFNQAAGVKPQTQERVEFTETRNLATDNPHTAWKIMAATSMGSEDMKRQNREAEGKRSQASGDTQASSVYSFSIAWHPDEAGKITREEMTTAADDALERLGLQDHQAYFVAHNDTAHPHIHVIANKTNPETGQTAKLWNDYKTLDKFAAQYREQRNEEHYCPDRAKKWLNHEQGVSNENRQKQTGAKLEKGESATMNADDPRAASVRKQNARDGNRLSEASKRQKEKHGDQWARFKAQNKAEKSAIFERYKAPMNNAQERLKAAKNTHAEIKASFKDRTDKRMAEIDAKYQPQKRDIGRKVWKDQRAWEAHENSLTGRLSHSISAAIHNRRNAPSKSKGFVKDTARMFLNTGDRQAAFKKMQADQWKPLNQHINAEKREARQVMRKAQDEATAHTREAMGAAVADIKNLNGHRSGELDSYKASQTTRYDDLKTNQSNERQKLQALWGSLKARRGASLRKLSTKLKEKAEVKNAHDQSVKSRFKDEAEDKAKKTTRNRNRSKERAKRTRGKTWKQEL